MTTPPQPDAAPRSDAAPWPATPGPRIEIPPAE